MGAFGRDARNRREQLDLLGQNFEGAVRVSGADAPGIFSLSTSVGDSIEFENGMRLGGSLSLFYDRGGSFVGNGVNDRFELATLEEGLRPTEVQGSFSGGDVVTALFDTIESSEEVQWGGTASVGLEIDSDNEVGLQYILTHTAEDNVILAEDTRGRSFAFPGFDINDPGGPGNVGPEVEQAPFIRTHSLTYTERTVGSLQLRGDHTFRVDDWELSDSWRFKSPEFSWVVADSFSEVDQPDRRLFGSQFTPTNFQPGNAVLPDTIVPGQFEFFRPGESIQLGNLQRIFTQIEEDSTQGKIDLRFPFEQWSDTEGHIQFGAFSDATDREFRRDTFTNSGSEPDMIFVGSFDEFFTCLLYTSPSPRDQRGSRMPSSA